MSALTFLMQVLGYNDVPPTSNPTSRPIDYQVTQANIPVDHPQTQSFDVDPGATVTVIDGTRVTSINGSTAFNLTLSPIDATIYRLTWTGAGAAPAFRTDRAVDATGIALTLVLQANLSLLVTAGSGTPFSLVVAGDVVFVPGPSTGDPTGPFNALNEGVWTVLSASGTVLTLGRSPDDVFSGASEVVTPVAASDFQAFTATGVQVGDTVDFSAGLSVNAQRAFDIEAVNPKWIEFLSTAPLGAESGVVPGTAGLTIYTARKRFIGIRSDQEISVRYNGDTGNVNRVEPLLAGILGMEGSETKFGTVWKLEIYNRSGLRASVQVASAE